VSFRHQALLYATEADYLEGTLPFVREGLAADEPVMIAVPVARMAPLRESLGPEGRSVRWVDMAGIGGNPARVIPLWREFVARHDERQRLRGIGEPIWPGRTEAEIAEGERHEALLNLAFADAPGLSILCPYDAGGLGPGVLDAAHASHPQIIQGATARESTGYRAPDGTFEDPLSPPPEGAAAVPLQPVSAARVRSLVSRSAGQAGLGRSRSDDLVVAVTAAALGVTRDATGATLTTWEEGGTVACEIRSDVRIGDPLAGREWPPPAQAHGLWTANQLADLVQLRSHRWGTVVRVRMTARSGTPPGAERTEWRTAG